MERNEPLCLALGMGAIGKAVSGYAMRRAGVRVIYADIAQTLIDTVNRDGGYWLGTADIYTKTLTKEFITGVSAVHTDAPEAQQAAIEADYMISAVGPKGFRALLPKAAGWLRARAAVTDKPLYYMVFENDHDAMELLRGAVREALGDIPSWLHLAKCSIERMTKVVELPDTGTTAIGETFFPIIADGAAMAGSGIAGRTDVIELADDVEKYYYRKLLTNNLGHAVLGYAGIPKGYTNTLEAMADAEIYTLLRRALEESGRAICAKWGFTAAHMQKHIDTLMLRYANPGLVDALPRLARDPLRKLSPDDRIVLPIRLCYTYGIPAEGLLEVLHRAICFDAPDVEGSDTLRALHASIGEAGILKTVCKADGTFLQDALRLAAT